MKIMSPYTVDTSNLDSTNIAIDSDDAFYGDDWQGEWEDDYPSEAGTGYAEGDVVYKGLVLYESLTGTNTDDPAVGSIAETPTWLNLGAINRWRMFDEYTNTLTTSDVPDPLDDDKATIEVVIEEDNVQTVSLFNLTGTYVDISILDDSDNELWAAETIDLWSEVEEPIDWFEYFFGDVLDQPRTDIFVDLEWATFAEKVKVEIIHYGTEAKCGLCLVGRSRFLGNTKWEPEVGILDYSRKQTDDFGRTYLQQGTLAKLLKARLVVPKYLTDATYRALAASRGTATVWNFNESTTEWDSLIVYGFFQDYRIVLHGPNYIEATLDIQGLI